MSARWSWILALSVLVVGLVFPAVEAFANHTAKITVKISQVKVLEDTDGFGAGCPDVFVYWKFKFLATGESRTFTTGETTACPPALVHVNVVEVKNEVPRPANSRYRLTYRVWDDDGAFGEDLMAAGSITRNIANACNGTTITRTTTGDSARIMISVRCETLVHGAASLESSGLQALPDPLINFPQTRAGLDLEVFDLNGKLVFTQSAADAAQLGTALRDTLRYQLAAGVYVYVLTARTWDGSVAGREVRKLVIAR